jgi:hypothetical protein
MVLRSITKTISINALPDAVFDFIANAENWPRWAVVNVKSISRGEGEWWNMETPIGPAKLRIKPNKDLGILDHDFIAPDAGWTVPARVVPNADGAEFIITFFQPPAFSNDFFDSQIKLVDIELAKLKEIMESQ